MPFSSNINTYRDVQVQLAEARRLGGALMSFRNRPERTKFKARVYKYRTLLRESAEAANQIPGLTPSTPYDDLIMRDDGELELIIEFGVRTIGKLQPLENVKRSVPRAEVVAEADLPATGDEDLLAHAKSLLGSSE
jgi:hypothetical protein